MVEASGSSRAVKVAILCTFWYFLSSFNNVINKRFLGNYPYPITLSLSHMASTAFLIYPVLLFFGIRTNVDVPILRFYVMLLPLGIGKLFVSMSSNASIWKIPISYAHTVKAMMPIFTVLLSRVVFQEHQTWMTYLSLLPIIAGVGIATVTELSFNLFGMLMSLTAAMVFTVQNFYTKRALKNLRLNHLHLLARIAHIAFVVVVPLWVIVDSKALFNNEDLRSYDNLVWFTSRLALSGVVNFTQNIMAFSVLNLLSPLSYSVATATKRILVISVSIATLRNPVTPVNVLGMLLAVLGVFIYNRTKAIESRKKLAMTLPYSEKITDVSHLNNRHRIINGRSHSYI